MIVSLQSTTFGAHGGIPTYNRVLCRALSQLTDSVKSQVFLVTDNFADVEPHRAEFPNLTFSAFSGNRVAFVWALARLILSRKCDLLLIGHVNYAALGLLLKFVQPSLRYGVTVHGVDVWSRLSFIKRRALQKADFVTSVSEYTKQRVISVNQVEANRIYILPNALEWKESDGPANVASPTPASAIRLLTVCRLSVEERYKGVDTVIEALPAIIRVVPDLQYFVIGSGTDLERHKELAESSGVSDRVHFLGSVDVETLKSHYRDCDIFAMPSAGEGFGIVFLEAMRYAKPVVAADSGAVAEVVEDGVTGALIKYGDKEHLAETITRLSLNPELRQRLGQAGYASLQQNFTFECFRKKFVEILNRELPAKTFDPSRQSQVTADPL